MLKHIKVKVHRVFSNSFNSSFKSILLNKRIIRIIYQLIKIPSTKDLAKGSYE